MQSTGQGNKAKGMTKVLTLVLGINIGSCETDETRRTYSSIRRVNGSHVPNVTRSS